MNDRLLQLSREYGFDSYKKIFRWKEYDIYAPWNKNDQLMYIGQPIYFLEKGSKVRVAQKSEWEEFILLLPDI